MTLATVYKSKDLLSMAEAESHHSDVLRPHVDRLLASRAYPKTICPSEVPRALTTTELRACSASGWRSLMPAVRHILWNMREDGEVEILQKGSLVPQGTELVNVKGPIRARKVKAEATDVENARDDP